MGLNDTPSGERVHIGFFGVRNAGKSSVVNAVTGQDLAVVSSTRGTTTDLVKKSMELLPLGPVTIVDTPGIDDVGGLGQLRVRKAKQALRSCDVAVLVVDAKRGMCAADAELAEAFERRGVPWVLAWNKMDVAARVPEGGDCSGAAASVQVSALTGDGVYELKECLARLSKQAEDKRVLVADLLEAGDVVVMVVPIDASAPKGRIILPQQMVLRDCLDAHASAHACQPQELPGVLEELRRPPRMVITDSQVFAEVADMVPDDVPLTSFSVLMARYKGELDVFARGAAALGGLRDGERVLVCEGCTHHRQCEDIGTVKIPAWVRARCGAMPEFDFTSGGEFPDALDGYALVIHCGGCMLNGREMRARMRAAQDSSVPIVNYGMAIAEMHGILSRCLEPFENE